MPPDDPTPSTEHDPADDEAMALDRHPVVFEQPVVELLLKLAALLAPFGGPHLFYDTFRSLLGKPVALVVTCAPVVLMYVGAGALADPDTSRWRKPLIRAGLLGAILLAAMNAYAMWRVAVVRDVALDGWRVFGLTIGTAAIVAYVAFARRALRPDSSQVRRESFGDMSRPIE